MCKRKEQDGRAMSTTKLQMLANAEENYLASLSTRKSVNNYKNASKLKFEKFTECVAAVSTSTPGTTTQETIAMNKNPNSSKSRNISNPMASELPDSKAFERDKQNIKSVKDFAAQSMTVIDKKNDKFKKSKKTTLHKHDITRICALCHPKFL
uniref:Uncharacterized protein n=1 Tax=Glossina austeni TaxID=7395 RepID=A0A1A9V0A1_GLOAU